MNERAPVLIYGNGAVARLLFSYIRREREVLGFTVDDHVTGGATEFCGRPLYPFSAVQDVHPPRDREMIIAVGFIEMNRLRLKKAQEARAKGYRLTSYVEPALIRHDGVSIGENTIILDCTSIHPGSAIGDSVFITSNVNIGHDCTIGDGAWINAGVSIAGGCTIGKGVFFGVNACVAQSVTIGDFAFLGAAGLADKDVSEGAVLIAQPATPIRLKSQDFLRFARIG
ncbi:MAG: acetyltransferase [Caulobacterales bacterium]